ncbi:MAG: sugar phosphate nucleotidyltransferase [Balneolaceae bacterium]
MKLIIPMAGRGTRVRPHSHTTPKPLLPVAGTMIIERIVETFSRTMDRKIDEIVYILGPDFGQPIRERLEAMSDRHGAKAVFRVQKIALGTAHAVYSAEKDLQGEVIVVFADTLFDTDSRVSVEGADSVIWLKEVEDPSRFGVAVHQGDTITDFVEKPTEPISNLAIIGVYYFRDAEQLKEKIRSLIDQNKTGYGGEYQLTDALDQMLKDGKTFRKATVDEWLDCGTLPAWLETTAAILDKENSQVDPARFPDSTIHPPVYIGEGVRIINSEIGPYASIEKGAVIEQSHISHSIIQQEAHIQRSRIHTSTVGCHARVEGAEGVVHLGDHSIIAAE